MFQSLRSGSVTKNKKNDSIKLTSFPEPNAHDTFLNMQKQHGANVTLVTGPTHEPEPAGTTIVHVTTAQEMLDACLECLPVDVAVCAAAVGDWRIQSTAKNKIKRGRFLYEKNIENYYFKFSSWRMQPNKMGLSFFGLVYSEQARIIF